MKKQNSLKLLSPLFTRASFTAKDAKILGVSAATLAYYVRKAKITRLGPGIYCLPESGIDTEFAWEDMVRVMPQIAEGVVCLITALVLHDLTDEISREFWVALPHKKRALKIDNFRFVGMRNMTLGTSTIKLGRYEINVFDEERTVVDAFRYLDKEVAIKALKRFTAKRSDSRKLQAYAKALRVNITPYLLTVTT